jgi:hypothetical protein
MNVSRISAPFAMILAAWSASAQMPDVAVTTPDATIAVEPGQQVDVPLVFTNNADAESPEVDFVITRFPESYVLEQRSMPECGAIVASPELAGWRQFPVAPIPARSARTCVVRVHRAADQFDNAFADWFIDETNSWVYFGLGTFVDIGIAAERVAVDDDPDGTIRTTYRMEATNPSAIDVDHVFVQFGPVCPPSTIAVDVDPDDGCALDEIGCAFGGSSAAAVRFSIPAGQDRTCVVHLTAPPGSDTHIDVTRLGAMINSSTGGSIDDDNGDNDHLVLDLAAGATNVNQEGLSGTWYDPAMGGQGMEFTFSPDDSNPGAGTFFGAWYTYDAAGEPDGGQRWYSLQSVLMGDAESLAFTIYQSTGGNFNAPPPTTALAVGSGMLTFDTCTTGSFAYSLDDGRSGTIPLQRLMPNVDCVETGVPSNPGSDFGLGGTWYDAGIGGQGVMIEINPSDQQAFFGWYTYAIEGESDGAAGQRWFTAQSPYVVGARTMEMTLYVSTGGAFDAPGGVTTTPVGSATLSFTSCTNAVLEYAFTDGELAGRSGSIPLTRLGAAPASCQAIAQ